MLNDFYASINYNVVARGIMFSECSCMHVCVSLEQFVVI